MLGEGDTDYFILINTTNTGREGNTDQLTLLILGERGILSLHTLQCSPHNSNPLNKNFRLLRKNPGSHRRKQYKKFEWKNTVKSKVENPIYVIARARFIPWEQLSLFFSRVFTLQSSVSSLYGYSLRQDLRFCVR